MNNGYSMNIEYTNHVVIDANYGDSGKGRAVDNISKYCLDPNPLVVRFSGSNNAGHTVYLNENLSNVFHLLGSGSFRNIPTYLYKHVSVDIVSLSNEIDKFKKLYPKYSSTVYIDPRCNLILPFDIVLNQLKEISRKHDLHGSTGNGLNESINRNEFFPIKVGTLKNSYELWKLSYDFFKNEIKKYQHILDNSLDFKFKNFVNELIDENNQLLFFNKLIYSLKHENIKIEIPNLSNFSCIFEGSQGLLLDEYNSNYPYVTRGRTGTHNIIDIVREFNIEIDQITYVTRPYLSRHGNDPQFSNNKLVHNYFNIIDKTNIHNQWQGSMKYNFIDISELSRRILNDFNVFKIHCKNVEYKIAITCVDQLKSEIYPFYNNGILIESYRSIEYEFKKYGHYVSVFNSHIN